MADTFVIPYNVPGNGRQRGTFIDFLDDAYIDTRNELMRLSWEQAEALASYITSHYVLTPREDIK